MTEGRTVRSIPAQLGRGAPLEIASGWRSLGAGTSMFHVKRSRPGAVYPRRYAASMRQAVRETPIRVEPPMTLGPRHDPSACAPLVLTPPPPHHLLRTAHTDRHTRLPIGPPHTRTEVRVSCRLTTEGILAAVRTRRNTHGIIDAVSRETCVEWPYTPEGIPTATDSWTVSTRAVQQALTRSEPGPSLWRCNLTTRHPLQADRAAQDP